MMREFNALEGYPEPKQPRVASKGLRTIHHRIIASYRGQDLYDGDRNYGYGGFSYDGRWLPIAKNMCREYNLDSQSSVLQVGCDKGFLLNDFLQVHSEMKVRGTEISNYPIENAMELGSTSVPKSVKNTFPVGTSPQIRFIWLHFDRGHGGACDRRAYGFSSITGNATSR